MRVLLVSTIAVALAGCGDDSSGTDAGSPDTGAPDAGAGVDSGQPDSGHAPSELFGPCVVDEQCPFDDGFCRPPDEGFPQGQCTRPCFGEDRTPCDDGVQFHYCVPQPDGTRACERRCLNGFDCGREAYTCFDYDADGICRGVCSSDEHCGPGFACNVYDGSCVPGEAPTVGGRHGEMCARAEDCLGGLCNAARSGSTPTGWNNGFCLGPCILPPGYNTNTFFAGDTLPTGTCPDGDICFPNGSFTEADLGVCVADCLSDADCRVEDGYECRKTFATASGSQTYTNGVCFPLRPASCTTGACPDGFRCVTVGSGRNAFNVCEKL